MISADGSQVVLITDLPGVLTDLSQRFCQFDADAPMSCQWCFHAQLFVLTSKLTASCRCGQKHARLNGQHRCTLWNGNHAALCHA